MKRFTLLLAAALLVIAAAPVSAANIVLVNLDPAGTGLNDTTPAAPVGGNPGTTIGEQRVNVYNLAAQIWGSILQSNVTVFVGATFQPLPCAPTGGVLGAAGPTYIFRDFPGAVPATWYHSALADAIFNAQLINDIDIISFFNSDIDDDDPNCLTGRSWYYGYDNNEGIDIDFLTVVLHEIAHGLGNSEFASEATGALLGGFPGIYARFMEDLNQPAAGTFADMTDAERLAAQVSTDNLVWTGASVTAAAPVVLAPQPTVKVKGKKKFRDEYLAQPASFGPGYKSKDCDRDSDSDSDSDSGSDSDSDSDSDSEAPKPKKVKGRVVLVDDGVGTGTDGCEPIANKVRGKIALIDRGACAFTQKVENAEAAGAKGVIIANNVAGGPAPMGGSSTTIGIASIGITLDDGNAIKAKLPKLNAEFSCDDELLAGAAANGQVKLYAPNPVQPGSSKSHWDRSATPNLLMEPSINTDLQSATDLDLTPFLFMDIGWVLIP